MTTYTQDLSTPALTIQALGYSLKDRDPVHGHRYGEYVEGVEGVGEFKTPIPDGRFEDVLYLSALDDAFAGTREREIACKALLQLNGEEIELADEEAKEYRRQKAKLSAERRVASENYRGGKELSWDDLEEATLKPLVGSWLSEGTLNFLVAKSNTGKTFLFLDMALSMATGRDFLGQPTSEGSTLIVLGEGKHGFVQRLKAWCADRGEDLEDVKPFLSFYEGGNLNNAASLEDMAAVVRKHEPALVIFDTWAATSGISDENASALASLTLNAAREAAPNAALLFTTHPTKSTEDTESPIMRGSSALAGSADCVMTLFADRKYRAASGLKADYLALSTERDHGGKNRNAARGTVQGLYLDSVEVEGNDSAVIKWDDSMALSKADLWVFEHMAIGEAVTIAELAERNETDDSKSTIERHIRASSAVEVVTPGKGNKPTTYTRTS